MPFAAAIIGSVVSAGIGAYGAHKSSKQQQKRIKQARNERREFGDIALGQSANETLAKLYGLDTFGERGGGPSEAFNQESLDAFRRVPGYQFTREESLDAIGNKLSASTGVQSGRGLLARQEYAAGLADKTFMGSYVNPLERFAARGQRGATEISNLTTGLGQAEAAGTIGITDSLQRGVQGVAGAFGSQAGLQYGSNQSAYDVSGVGATDLDPNLPWLQGNNDASLPWLQTASA